MSDIETKNEVLDIDREEPLVEIHTSPNIPTQAPILVRGGMDNGERENLNRNNFDVKNQKQEKEENWRIIAEREFNGVSKRIEQIRELIARNGNPLEVKMRGEQLKRKSAEIRNSLDASQNEKLFTWIQEIEFAVDDTMVENSDVRF